MQIKFLPNLRNLLKPRNAPQEEPLQSDNETTAGKLNLLSSDTGYSSIYTKGLITHVDYSISKLILYLQIFIYSIIFVFIFLVLFNVFIDWRLNVQKDSLNGAVASVQKYAEQEKLLRSVSERISLYKNVTDNRKSVTTKIDMVFSNIGTDLKINEISVDGSRFYVKVRGSSPIVFARLINAYLSKGITNEISLKSANLDPITNEFIVELEGKFK